VSLLVLKFSGLGYLKLVGVGSLPILYMVLPVGGDPRG